MKVFLSLGSNLEPRREYLSKAIEELSLIGLLKQISPVYESPALLPPEAPSSWNKSFLNLAVELEYFNPPKNLLTQLKKIEKKLGRKKSQKWTPRNIDLDILLFGEQTYSSEDLQIPHLEMEKRAFVLDPLKDILPRYIQKARQHRSHSPLWMSIVNLTPDSFSSDKSFFTKSKCENHFLKTLEEYEKLNVAIIDLGAESTRPGGTGISWEEELDRLKPFLKQLRGFLKNKRLKPLISIDTRHSKTAEFSLNSGADIINDVSGLKDPEMLSLLKDSTVDYVLTHSLDVPVDPKNTLDGDPLKILCQWLEEKLEIFYKNNISINRIFFDPGIGFGKDSLQSLKILRNLRVFHSYPVKLLVGHSRKSFMNCFSPFEPASRDLESLGVSMGLIQQGVDVLRVHNPEFHIRGLRGWNHIQSY